MPQDEATVEIVTMSDAEQRKLEAAEGLLRIRRREALMMTMRRLRRECGGSSERVAEQLLEMIDAGKI